MRDPRFGRPAASSVLVVIGLLATLWLLWRRDLWCGTVRRLPPERRLGLEAFTRSLLDQPPTRQVQLRQLGDLQLVVCRQSGGRHGKQEISVRSSRPQLSPAEAEWTLEAITAVFTGQPGPSPVVVGSADGLFLIVLADPTIPAPAADQQAADDHTLPNYFLPLLTLTPSEGRPSRAN